jgi:hypothetical protein
MQTNQLKRNASQIYLTLIPFLSLIIALALGHSNYKIYLPIWIINACLMVIAAWILGAYVIRNHDAEKKQLIVIASFLIIPWILLSILLGLGPPPFDKPTEYVATATEQQVRYSFLLISGVLITFGFAVLRENLKKTGENFYSWIGLIAIMIAIPLFILNMAYYNNFLLETFRIRVTSASDKMPEWFSPIHKQMVIIMAVEVALTYLATAAFAASLKSAGWFKKTASHIYIIISLLCFLSALLVIFTPEPIASACSIVCIPALPFIMPYFIGINLLRRAGN